MSLLATADRNRRTARNRLLLLLFGLAVLAAAAALALWLVLRPTTTAEPGAIPAPQATTGARVPHTYSITPTPGDTDVWTAPRVASGPLILPQPASSARGVPVGFPHTTEGAISAAARYAQLAITLDADQARTVGEVAAAASYPSAGEEMAMGVRAVRRTLGVAGSGDELHGAYLSFLPQSYKVVDATTDGAVVQILGTVEGAGPATSGQGRSVPYLIDYQMAWVGGDWKIAGPGPGSNSQHPPSARTAEAYEGGWRDLALA